MKTLKARSIFFCNKIFAIFERKTGLCLDTHTHSVGSRYAPIAVCFSLFLCQRSQPGNFVPHKRVGANLVSQQLTVVQRHRRPRVGRQLHCACHVARRQQARARQRNGCRRRRRCLVVGVVVVRRRRDTVVHSSDLGRRVLLLLMLLFGGSVRKLQRATKYIENGVVKCARAISNQCAFNLFNLLANQTVVLCQFL